MPSTTQIRRGRSTEPTSDDPTNDSERWLPPIHFDPDSVSGVHADLKALRDLPPNWDGYGAPRIESALIEAAKSFVAKLTGSLAVRPKVVPMSNGTLQLEWHEGSKSLELEFESPRSIRYLQWHPEAGIEDEDSFSIEDIDTAIDLIHWFTTGVCG